MTLESEEALISRYEELRRLLTELDRQAKDIDSELLEIETGLPDWYRYADDHHQPGL